jgi:hypothetical protein
MNTSLSNDTKFKRFCKKPCKWNFSIKNVMGQKYKKVL